MNKTSANKHGIKGGKSDSSLQWERRTKDGFYPKIKWGLEKTCRLRCKTWKVLEPVSGRLTPEHSNTDLGKWNNPFFSLSHRLTFWLLFFFFFGIGCHLKMAKYTQVIKLPVWSPKKQKILFLNERSSFFNN